MILGGAAFLAILAVLSVLALLKPAKPKRVHPSGERFKAGDRVVDEYGDIIE